MSVRDKIRNNEYTSKLLWGKSTRLNKEYSKDQSRLSVLFQEEALAEVGLADHPKREMIFYKAYEHGHAYGYEEVFNELESLAELFK